MARISEKHRANVQILLADGDSVVRHGLRNALNSEGYRDVRAVGRFKAVCDTLNASAPDLLIIDSDLPDGDAIELIKAIRCNKTGKNPFLPIIVMTYDTDQSSIGKSANYGVDFVLLKPLAPADLLSRIDGVAFNRNRFVATADYIGPDRRNGERGEGVTFFDVPNTLKDRLEGRSVDLAELSEQVKSTMKELNNSRVEQAALNLANTVDEICASYQNGEVLDDIDRSLGRILRNLESVKEEGPKEISQLCAVLAKTVAAIRQRSDNADAGQLELLRPLSQSILLASKPDVDIDVVMAQISAVMPKDVAQTARAAAAE